MTLRPCDTVTVQQGDTETCGTGTLGQCDAGIQSHYNTGTQSQCGNKKLIQYHSAVWVKVAQAYFSEMRSGVKMGSPPDFLCHTDKEILCFVKYYKELKL